MRSDRTIRRTILLGQFVADNLSRTIPHGQLVAKYDINVIGNLLWWTVRLGQFVAKYMYNINFIENL